MPQIKLSTVVISLAVTFLLGGCGDKNSQVNYDADSAKHIEANWVRLHPTEAAKAIDSCTRCHGSNYDGGIARVSCGNPTAVSGFTCHASNVTENMTGCKSCHGDQPAGPFGNTAPNRQFAHAFHTALLTQAGFAGYAICGKCHSGAGYGTENHAKATAAGEISRATVVLTSGFEAKNPVGYGFSQTNENCSSVACHGGKPTPVWSDSIDIVAGDNTVCFRCHEAGTSLGNPQINSYYSGLFSGTSPATKLHASHLNTQDPDRSANCTDCHNISALSNILQHFGGIKSSGVSLTAPGKTVGGAPTDIGSYNTATQTCSAVSCHPQFDRKWNN